MNRLNILLLFTLITLITPAAGCFVYHESAFKGTILDIDTKQPIEGAVVVVEYKKESMGVGAGKISSIINVRETLTDKDGNFKIPSYTTIKFPFTWKDSSILIIYKPGYASLEMGSWHFIGEKLKEEQEGSWYWAKELKYKLRGAGIVELPQVLTWEERNKANTISPTDDNNQWPLLHKIIEDEDNWLINNKGWRR